MMENKKFLCIVQQSTNHQKILLSLQDKSRLIGEIEEDGEGILIIRRKPEHILRKLNAIGINYELLSDPRLHYKWIKILCGDKEYISTREYFLTNGKALQFSGKGFELQVFVPINELNIETLKKFATRQPRQLNLFDDWGVN